METASVIIPTRNRAEILPETLRSLARQSIPPGQLEVVVIDDGSTDDTAARLRASGYPFRLMYERLDPREGFCPARPRNAGLHLATGEIAIFLDADIVAAPGLVAGHVAAHAFGQGPGAVIGYTYGYPRDPAERTPDVMQPPPAEAVLEELPRLVERDGAHWRDGREPSYAATRDLVDHPAPWQAFWTSNASVERRLALEIGGFDEEFVGWGGEDTEFAYRLHERGVGFTLARQAWGVHYPHPLPDLDERRAEAQRNRRRLIAKHPGPELEMQLWSPRFYPELWTELEALLRQPPLLAASPSAAELVEWLQTTVVGQLAGSHLECGGLPPLSSRELAPVAGAPTARAQERRVRDGGKPPARKRWQVSSDMGFGPWLASRRLAPFPPPRACGRPNRMPLCAQRRVQTFRPMTQATALQIGLPWMRQHDQSTGKPVRPPLLCGPAPQELAASLRPAAWCQPFRQTSGAGCDETSLPLLGLFTPWEDNTFGGALVTDYWRSLPPILALGIVTECVRVAGAVALMCSDEAPAANAQRFRPRTLEECGDLLQFLRSEYPWDIVPVESAAAFRVSRRSRRAEPR